MYQLFKDESWTRLHQINRIYLMVKSPTTLFVYWEIAAVYRDLLCEHLHKDWSEMACFIRLNDVTGVDYNGHNSVAQSMIAVHPSGDNWYLHNVAPCRYFVVDFGVTTSEGNFLAVLRSNAVQTPPEPVATEPSICFAPLNGCSLNNLRQVKPELPVVQTWLPDFDGYSLVSAKEDNC